MMARRRRLQADVGLLLNEFGELPRGSEDSGDLGGTVSQPVDNPVGGRDHFAKSSVAALRNSSPRLWEGLKPFHRRENPASFEFSIGG